MSYAQPLKWFFANTEWMQDTSEWTLDYPPFFGVLEWLLSKVAVFADPAMVKLENLNYDSWKTVYFQRSSVIILEIFLVFALNRYDSRLDQHR